MSSQSTADGRTTITVTFALGTDLDMAQVLVQNRVNTRCRDCPKTCGGSASSPTRSTPDILMVVHLYSPDGSRDQLYLSNYALLNVRDQLAGSMASATCCCSARANTRCGSGSIRIGLAARKPDRGRRGAGPSRAERAGRRRRARTAAVDRDRAPTRSASTPSAASPTRRSSATSSSRAPTKGDSCACATSAASSLVPSTTRPKPISTTSPRWPSHLPAPGRQRARDGRRGARADGELAPGFPEGIDYRHRLQPDGLRAESIANVVRRRSSRRCWWSCSCVLFLQTWRASIIPLVAVPVSLIGTFAVMQAFGFSLNTLSLFGLVLAIGIVVDDAIVVVENVERHLDRG